ncbi:caspase family protein [Neobacillus jeddahensis]|uniref:caspase family protein n=1 Tax=Neobacillus jeddahensis TaxID=1461580 RepID=UPI00058EA3A9|nr:caspase family protein [Neobacillus jeddahensis]
MGYKALIIAVDQYQNTSNLPNTKNDAYEIRRLLLESPSLFNDNAVQLFEGTISKKSILLAALNSFFQEADQSDVLFLFWAGHGYLNNENAYFVPFDAQISFPEATMIKMDLVRELIDQTAASTVLSFFDTCHSGAIARRLQRGMFRGLEVNGAGKVLIAACTDEQVAWDRAGHGAFTDYLIRGLEGEAANQSGEIDVYHLYSYVSGKLEEEFGNQEPVIKSTLEGKPLLLKRVVNRGDQTNLHDEVVENKVVNSSGVCFWFGPIISEYDEYREPKTGIYELKLIDPSDSIEQSIRSLRQGSKHPFAIRNQADFVILENVDIHSTRNQTVFTLTLKSTGEKSPSSMYEMSIGIGMGKTISADEIASLRARRILLGEKLSSFYDVSLLESVISNPTNAKVKVIPDMVSTLLKDRFSYEKIRVMIVGSLILTGTVETIERLSFTVENNSIKGIHLIAYRAKYYSNVDPAKVEINETV